MSNERWKPIVGYESLYEISDLGRVRSKKRNTTSGKILKGAKRPDGGYISVVLFKEGSGKCMLIHRLVAEAFISNPENKPEVNHLDGNKQNNCVSNLSWCTPSENQQHSLKIGLRPSSQLNDGGTVHITKQVNDRINELAEKTGRQKWEIVNDLLLNALERYERPERKHT